MGKEILKFGEKNSSFVYLFSKELIGNRAPFDDENSFCILQQNLHEIFKRKQEKNLEYYFLLGKIVSFLEIALRNYNQFLVPIEFLCIFKYSSTQECRT